MSKVVRRALNKNADERPNAEDLLALPAATWQAVAMQNVCSSQARLVVLSH